MIVLFILPALAVLYFVLCACANASVRAHQDETGRDKVRASIDEDKIHE